MFRMYEQDRHFILLNMFAALAAAHLFLLCGGTVTDKPVHPMPYQFGYIYNIRNVTWLNNDISV